MNATVLLILYFTAEPLNAVFCTQKVITVVYVRKLWTEFCPPSSVIAPQMHFVPQCACVSRVLNAASKCIVGEAHSDPCWDRSGKRRSS